LCSYVSDLDHSQNNGVGVFMSVENKFDTNGPMLLWGKIIPTFGDHLLNDRFAGDAISYYCERRWERDLLNVNPELLSPDQFEEALQMYADVLAENTMRNNISTDSWSANDAE
jgi:hypothetical protein